MNRDFKGIWIPKHIWLDKNLSWTEKIILLEIHSFTSKEMECFFSNAYLAEFIGVSVPNITRSISSLIEKGYIEQTKFDGRNRYLRSLMSEELSLIKLTTQPNQIDEADSSKTESLYNNTNNNTTNKNGFDWEHYFEQMWLLYPNRSGKADARRHFKAKVKNDELLERFKTAMANYLKCEKVRNGFVKDGSTFFNQWEDWVSPTPSMMGRVQTNTNTAYKKL